MVLVCSLVVVTACGGPSAQAIPTPTGDVPIDATPKSRGHVHAIAVVDRHGHSASHREADCETN